MIKFPDDVVNFDFRAFRQTLIRLDMTVQCCRCCVWADTPKSKGESMTQYHDFLQELRNSFRSQSVEFSVANEVHPLVRVTNKYASAVISIYGVHILDFTPRDSRNLLWVSTKSFFEDNRPIRGGIPVCWPWFGPAKDPAHGLARIAVWTLERICDEIDGSTTLYFSLDRSSTLGLKASAEINIGHALTFCLTTENTGKEEVEMTEALHSYFAISAIDKIKITGLDGAAYTDKVDGQRKVQNGNIFIDSETDRVYDETDDTVIIHDSEWNRAIKVEKSGSNTTVVWNPWIKKAKAMADFGDEEYKTMVCVETANAGKDVVVLKPGRLHTLSTRITQL